jgi:hypothetical protein
MSISTPDDPDPTFPRRRRDTGRRVEPGPEFAFAGSLPHAPVLLVDPRRYALGSPELLSWSPLC